MTVRMFGTNSVIALCICLVDWMCTKTIYIFFHKKRINNISGIDSLKVVSIKLRCEPLNSFYKKCVKNSKMGEY